MYRLILVLYLSGVDITNLNKNLLRLVCGEEEAILICLLASRVTRSEAAEFPTATTAASSGQFFHTATAEVYILELLLGKKILIYEVLKLLITTGCKLKNLKEIHIDYLVRFTLPFISTFT